MILSQCINSWTHLITEIETDRQQTPDNRHMKLALVGFRQQTHATSITWTQGLEFFTLVKVKVNRDTKSKLFTPQSRTTTQHKIPDSPRSALHFLVAINRSFQGWLNGERIDRNYSRLNWKSSSFFLSFFLYSFPCLYLSFTTSVKSITIVRAVEIFTWPPG